MNQLPTNYGSITKCYNRMKVLHQKPKGGCLNLISLHPVKLDCSQNQGVADSVCVQRVRLYTMYIVCLFILAKHEIHALKKSFAQDIQSFSMDECLVTLSDLQQYPSLAHIHAFVDH